MNSNLRFASKLVVVVFFLLSSTAFSSGSWKLFRSSDKFSIEYPSWWFPIGASGRQLQIRSSKGGAEGVIIKSGQALISVRQESSPKTMAQVINLYTHEMTELSRKNISLQSDHRHCSLTEIVAKEPVISPEDAAGSVPITVNTMFFCELQNRNIVLVLRNYEGDKRQSQYQQVALRMAKSISLQE